ncbi:hypothetical protein PS3A_57600 [Pseudomonas sp. 3A(2025)]
MPAADAFALSPFHYSTVEQGFPALHTELPSASEIDPNILKRLRRLRKSPGFALLADSVLLLQSMQLDMDYPPPWHHYARQRLSAWLLKTAGKSLDPDTLKLHLNSPHAWVDGQGAERGSLECSLTELAIASANMQQLSALAHCLPTDDKPLAELPQLTASALLRQIIDNRWFDDYQQQLDVFWQRHAGTWLNLARLSFLDGLARQRTRKTLSHAGLYLTLDALGYRTFPTESQALQPGDPGDKAELRLLYIDDEVVPGLFQIRSRLNSHCFIHLPGTAKETVEYISDDSAVMTARLLDAVNGSKWHRQWLDGRQTLHDSSQRIESRPFEGEVFNELLLAARDFAEQPPNPHGDALLHRFIARAMTLACAVDLWQATPEILDNLPSTDAIAAERMKHWLQQQGLDLDPHHVFIAYRPGHTRTPLGQVNHANTHVRVPDETPLSLTKALISHYRIESPSGYIDHGAQTVVYHDPNGKGQWAKDRLLPVSAAALCEYIEQIDFLAIMTRRLDEFWDGQQGDIDKALRTLLISQAVISLKHGTLQRTGFDAVVLGLNSATPGWRALGFEVQSSFVEGLIRQPCAGMLVLCPANTQRRVLYQAGQHKALIEFENSDALSAYLRTAAAGEPWRSAVLHYVPTHHRERLAWLFRFWSGVAPASSPASLLRPWTDVIYRPDAHQTLDHSLHEHSLPPGPPVGFMRQTLKANALEDARQLIVTSRQASLQYWSARMVHLQWLLAPMSLLLTPALIASLATEAGMLALNIAQASLPGQRQAEKRQVLLSMLSLGLLGLAPFTPRLLGALSKVSSVSKVALRAPQASTQTVRGVGAWLRRSLHPRQTRLEKFFHTDSLLKRWTVHPHPNFGGQPVHAWKLGHKFLLWTSDRGQARTLVVSTHGYYLPWSKTVPIPNGTHIHTYAPDGHTLVDPMLHRVVSQRVSAFGSSSAAGNTLLGTALPPLLPTGKLVAGTDLPGRLKNYTLTKFQTPGGENYQEIVRVVRNSHHSLLAGQLPSAPMDVLSVRNRFGSTSPTLADLFGSLASQGIHYDRILLLHCRCSAIGALLRRAPVWTAPIGHGVPVTP